MKNMQVWVGENERGEIVTVARGKSSNLMHLIYFNVKHHLVVKNNRQDSDLLIIKAELGSCI